MFLALTLFFALASAPLRSRTLIVQDDMASVGHKSALCSGVFPSCNARTRYGTHCGSFVQQLNTCSPK